MAAINKTEITINYDSDSEEFACVLEFCEPIPGRQIFAAIEGHGQTLSDALRDLADQVADQYEGEEEEKVECA